MAPRFATVSKVKILAENEGAQLQEIPRRRQIWVVDVYWSVEKNFLTEFATKL